MQTDFLDKHERQYLQACQWPPRTMLQTFFWYFLPAIGAAATAAQWVRGIDTAGIVITAAIFAVLVLIYFPLVAIVARPFSQRVINWSGVARSVPAPAGTRSEDFIGDTRVVLPIGWDDRFRAMSGRDICAHGVAATASTPPRVQVLSLDGECFVSREVPAGLARIGLPQLHFGLAVVPLGVLLGIAMRTRFYVEYLLFFGAVSAGFALYGILVVRRNQIIRLDIDALYDQPESSDFPHKRRQP